MAEEEEKIELLSVSNDEDSNSNKETTDTVGKMYGPHPHFSHYCENIEDNSPPSPKSRNSKPSTNDSPISIKEEQKEKEKQPAIVSSIWAPNEGDQSNLHVLFFNLGIFFL